MSARVRGASWGFMNWPTAVRLLAKPELDRFLDETISRLRWATIAALLLISLAQPSTADSRVREWVLTLLFAGYNVVTDVVRRRARRAFAWIAVLDLPAVALVYYFASQLGGPPFALLVLAAAQTAAFMTLTGSLCTRARSGSSSSPSSPRCPGGHRRSRTCVGRAPAS